MIEKKMNISRREFLKFLGSSAVVASASFPVFGKSKLQKLPSLTPSTLDTLKLVDGLQYQIICKFNDPIGNNLKFGSHCDFTAFIPLTSQEALLFVNHETPEHIKIFRKNLSDSALKKRIEEEMLQIGASILHLKKNGKNWELIQKSSYNRRFYANTEIPFEWDTPISGKKLAIGMVSNCSGGVTPWGTVLTCEENYQDYYEKDAKYGWQKFFEYPPQHYGWVNEIDPKSGKIKKLVSLGRFNHEGALVIKASDGTLVVYMGEDKNDGFLYKFISASKKNLDRGLLYCADIKNGKWLLLDYKHPTLKDKFSDETDILVRVSEAAKILGATPLARPEGMAFYKNQIFVSLTNHIPKGDYFGSLFKLVEKDPTALEFNSSIFLMGGEKNGFSCPDNIAFDLRGNLWMTSDISGKEMNQGPYTPFKNNGLFYIPLSGENAGKSFQLASAPTDAEFTGPSFTSDGKTLFLSVQHPGEESTSVDKLTSHWPSGKDSLPVSSVVAISGPLLESLG